MYDVLYGQYMRGNHLAEAEELLRQKVQNNPNQANYLLQLMAHYYAMKKFDQMDEAMKALNDEKRFPDGHLLAGDFFLFRARDYDRAREQYDAGEKGLPETRLVYQKRQVELLATSGQSQDAARKLETILAAHPKDDEAISMHAALLLQIGNAQQIKSAESDLQSLVTKTPDNHLLRFNLARAMLAQNEIEPARLQLEAAIKLRPDFIVARELLAKIYLSKGDAGGALKAADDIIAISGNDMTAHLVKSSALIGLDERDKARQELELIQKIAPENVDARYQMGYMAWQAKDFKQSEQVFGELYKSNPKDPRGLMGVVETYASEN
jgi:tetratricopeptide (TPR) repeat protein